MFKFSIRRCANAGKHGNTELADSKYREEMAYWIGPSVFGRDWQMSKIDELAVSYIEMRKPPAKKESDILMSSAVGGMISSKHDERGYTPAEKQHTPRRFLEEEPV